LGKKRLRRSGGEIGVIDEPSNLSSPLNNETADSQTTGTPESSEDQALALLAQPDVSAETISQLSRSAGARNRKVMLAIAIHHGTPRHVSLPLLRRLFTFDLMQVTLSPTVAADIKRAAEEQLLIRLESLSAGEKTSLARRGSGRVAARFLQENDLRIISPALDNSQLTEASVVQALMKLSAPEILFALVSEHRKWSQRREVQMALLRSEKTPLERAREFVRNFSDDVLRETLPDGRTHLLERK
jgi:hypothetical protein